jgi:hypothetical protein
VLLALDNVMPRTTAVVAAGATGLWFVFLWGIAPRWALRHGNRDTDADAG